MRHLLRCPNPCLPSAAAGFYVLIDSHLNSDSTPVDDPNLWLQGWGRIMTAIAKDPIANKFVM